MSLFPAYTGTGEGIVDSTNVAETSWLQNASFASSLVNFKPPNRPKQPDSDSCDSEEQTHSDDITTPQPNAAASTPTEAHISSKRKKSKSKQKKKKRLKSDTDNHDYVIDTYRDLNYLKMTQQSKSARPAYEKPTLALPGVVEARMIFGKSKRVKRYFSKKCVITGFDDLATGEELKKRSEELNKLVYDEPDGVENWLKLVDFQDDYFRFQALQFNSVGERERAVNSQKMSILEKAIKCNEGSEQLLKAWLRLATAADSIDEVEEKLTQLQASWGESLLLSLARVLLTQLSMPRCSSPAVIRAYASAIEAVQKWRHVRGEEQDLVSVELLWHACVFLQQAGLWELAWKALELSLSLNLELDIPSVCACDPVVLAEENKILEASKGVPIWHLWNKLETLRQSHHFLPIAASSDFPQRMVTAAEVAGLVFHTRPTAHLRLLTLLPLLSKVPPLPKTHAIVRLLTSQLSPWLVDTVEWHLAGLFTVSPLFRVKSEFVANHLPASCPPQYLAQQTGQQEFFALAVESFGKVLSVATGRQRVAIGCWYLRFLRWLDQLAAATRFKRPPKTPKTKTMFKEFLAKDQNRDELLFYLEYSLWEFDAVKPGLKGGSDTINTGLRGGLKTLSTVIASRGDVLSQFDDTLKTDLCALYRTLCEMQISCGQREEALITLMKLCNAANVAVAGEKLRDVAVECRTESNDTTVRLEGCLLPLWVVDWPVCYALFKALMGEPSLGLEFLNGMAASTASDVVRERLLESITAISHAFGSDKTALALEAFPTTGCDENALSPALRLLQAFPANGGAAVAVGAALVGRGGLWWRQLGRLLSDPVNSVTAVCVVLERQRRSHNHGERARALLDQQTRGAGRESRASVLLHRMQIKQLAEAGETARLDTARLLALEAYPWNKGLYMDAIAATPAQLLPLTDLIVEKELRIHITPDEIEALRD